MFKNIHYPLLIAIAIAMVGCEGGGDSNAGPYGNISSSGSSSSTSSNNQFVGTWSLTEKDTSNVWYIHFVNDGSWKITDDAAGTITRVHGNYNYTGNEFEGPMYNPGVGEGKIGGNVTDGVMTLHFKEYWHTPHKVVDYTGTKVK